MIEEYMMCWESMNYNVWICNNPDLFAITNLLLITVLILIIIYVFRNIYTNAILRQEKEQEER